jgi:glycosyltransferase involved in cell wall biosynthesis
MIKVCHMTSAHKRLDMRIFRKECVSLAKAGYDVHLLVADGLGNTNIEGVNIYDTGKENGRLKRFIFTTGKIFRQAVNLECDIYHFHDPDLALVGLRLKLAGKKVIWDMHENLPADILQKDYMPYYFRRLVAFFFKSFEKYVAGKIDAIICTRDSVMQRLNTVNSEISLVNNFPLVNYKVYKTAREERAICFAGTIVPNYQHKEIIMALEEIDNVKYLLAGPACEKYLVELKSLTGWRKVEYQGVISFEEVKKMYSRANVGMVVHQYTHNMDWVTGNFALTKIFEVLFWEMPVVSTKYTLWEETIFKKAKCGISVHPADVAAIKNAIEYLLDHPEEAKQMGKMGREAIITHYNWGSQEKLLLDLYKRIIA